MPDILQTTINQFCDDVEGFLEAMGAVWPECEGVAQLRREFGLTARSPMATVRNLAQRTIIDTFHREMAPFYTRVRAEDGSIFFEAGDKIDILKNINMAAKWDDQAVDDVTRKNVFAWLIRICGHSELYSFYARVPPAMLRRFTGVAMDLASQDGTGNLDATIRSIMDGVDHQELQSFAETIMAEPSSFQSLVGLLGSGGVQKELPPTLQGLASMVQTMAGSGPASS